MNTYIECLIPSARFVKTTRVDATIPCLKKQTHTSSSHFGPGSKMLRYVTCTTSSCNGACMHDLNLCLIIMYHFFSNSTSASLALQDATFVTRSIFKIWMKLF